jgi:hypothetical protein
MTQPIVPTMVPVPAKYRGPSSSSDYNATIDGAYNDIVTMSAALQKLQSYASLQNEIVGTQYASMAIQIGQLEAELISLQSSFDSLLAAQNSTQVGIGSAGAAILTTSFYGTPISYGGFPSFYPPGSPLLPQGRAVYAPTYGQVIPSLITAPVSKAYVIDLLTQTIVTPPNVVSVSTPVVTPTIAPVSISETDPANAVDGDSSSYWRRNVFFQSSQFVTNVQQTVTLTIPQQYINNATCNYVTIHPYPEFGVDIISVVVYGTTLGTNAGTQILPISSASTPIPIKNAGKTRLFFPAQAVDSIAITFSQSNPNYVLVPGQQAFTFGASVIDFGFANFNQNPSVVLVPFTLGNNFFSYVVGVGPTQSGVSYNLWYLDPAQDLVAFTIGQVLPGYVQTVFVELVLTASPGIAPVVNQVQLQYFPLFGAN